LHHPEGTRPQRADWVNFDRHVRVALQGAQISSDGGLLLMRDLDDALGCPISRKQHFATPDVARIGAIVLTAYSVNRCSGDWPGKRM
jgi:hypothetical protein